MLKKVNKFKFLAIQWLDKFPYQNERASLLLLILVVSNIIFCIIFVAFSYCGTYFDTQLSFCDVIVIKEKGIVVFIVWGWS